MMERMMVDLMALEVKVALETKVNLWLQYCKGADGGVDDNDAGCIHGDGKMMLMLNEYPTQNRYGGKIQY